MEGFQQHASAKILRAPSLKRGKPDERITDRIKLERVLGVTVSSNAALDSDPNSEIVAYPAGCTVVLFNTQSGQQSHIINTSRKSVTSLAFSTCGRYLVTGECGHQPAVRVWDLQSDPQSGHPGLYPQVQQVAEFMSHKYGVNCVAFSPTNKYVVSVGTQHDMIVNVWDWKNNIKVASNKVSTKVKALAFSENGSYFVTVGNRHVKFWFLEPGRTKYKEAVPLMGRSAILGEQRNNYFCDVACGKAKCGDSTYAITRSGLLCEFNNRRLLDKWVELRTTSANCIAVGENLIFVGCAEGIVRCFDPVTLKFITTLPRTHYLGVDVSQGLNIGHMSSKPNDAKYPDTIAITYDESSNKLTCIYNDHSVYVWDVHDIKRVGKSHSFLYHSACIWGVEMAPPQSPLPPGSFLTCSSDDTMRVWKLDKLNEKSTKGVYKRNIYSNELLKVVYVDHDLTYLKDLDLSATNVSNEKQESSYDGRNGVRCIRLSPDGKHLASGDRAGNIRIHETSSMKKLLQIEAHDAEVLCLEYSNFESGLKLMASASRDRLIHVFDVSQDYSFLQTLDDHSSSITAVRLLNAPHGNLQMVSCGADKSLLFRSLGGSPHGTPQFVRGHIATGKTTLYDMEVDAGQKHILTACQDRNVRIYSVGTGKHTKSFKGSTGDDGTLIKVVLDRSGIYLATSCTDKSLSVYDYYTGECMATMCGHSELATGLRFTNDCRRLISASGDGCIFVWRVPHDMVVTMHARLSQQAMRQGKTLDSEIFTEGNGVDFYDANSPDQKYRFSIGQLPQWAKKHISDDISPPASLAKGVAAPKGRWAQRAERSVGVKSFYTDSVISFPTLQERRIDSDGSKESSLEGATETRHYTESRREILISKQFQDEEFTPHAESYDELSKSPTPMSPTKITMGRGDIKRTRLNDAALDLRDPDNESTAHDADIDSDQEYRFQPLYYPTQVDSASGSEFNVMNIDADELRRSVRKSKRESLPTIPLQNTTPLASQDSDDDEDEASTPSGENTDRNPMSLLSISSESLDQLANREKYLQSTFESLSSGEIDTPGNKSSISAQFHTRSNGTTKLRNMAVINAAKQTKNDPDAVRKREQLNQMIADTRKKLANVGYNSPLKYSKSIHDLSHIPEKDKWSSPNRKQGNFNEITNCSCFTPIPNQNQINRSDFPYTINDTNSNSDMQASDAFQHYAPGLPSSISLPTNLQLCGCYLRDLPNSKMHVDDLDKAANQISNFAFLNASISTLNVPSDHQTDTNVTGMKLSDMLNKSPEKSQKQLAAMIRPRKLKLDKTLTKYKMHKSLPVSPVSEECRFSDFSDKCELSAPKDEFSVRRSFSYFIDFNKEVETEKGFKQICADIENFSKDFNKNYEDIEHIFDDGNANVSRSCQKNQEIQIGSIPEIQCQIEIKSQMQTCAKIQQTRELCEKAEDEEGNFSSDSLEDSSFNSTRNRKARNSVTPRRCVSNNEIYNYQDEERDYSTFYHAYDCSIPKTESFYLNQSNKNSQESILSDDNLDYDYQRSKSYCNSLESVLSNESECRSAPLEVLFTAHRRGDKHGDGEFSKSLPKSTTTHGNTLPKSYDESSESTYLKPFNEIRRSQTFTVDERPTTPKVNLRTSQTQTEMIFKTPEEIVAKKANLSTDFQQKLLKFETCIAQNELKTRSREPGKKSIAFFVDAEHKSKASKSAVKEKNEQNGENKTAGTNNTCSMYIPTLETKNKQYKSKFCNVLNNKPEFNVELFESGNKNKNSSFTLTNLNFERSNRNQIQETSSLDRHLVSKGLLDAEKICHKPPKAVRRHSSKTRKARTSYEYIKKDDFFKDIRKYNNTQNIKKSCHLNNCSNENLAPTVEKTIEFCYKEKNLEKECEKGNIFTELYDSLDKPILNTRIEHDSLEININNEEKDQKMYDSLELDLRNVWTKHPNDEFNVWKDVNIVDKLKAQNYDLNISSIDDCPSAMNRIQFALENIKILNEIQKKIHKINNLVDVFKQNMCVGKVRALSSMYESLTNSRSYYNDLSKHQLPQVKFRRRNLSLPNFVERRLNTETKVEDDPRDCGGRNMEDNCQETKDQNLEARRVPKTEEVVKKPKQNLNRNEENGKNAALCKRAVVNNCSRNDRAQPNITRVERESPNARQVHIGSESPDSSLRRSCSLSDLSMQSLVVQPKRKVEQGSGKLTKSTSSTRANSRYAKNLSITRSSSTGVLNQSDSDTESNERKTQSRLMRPTISSLNKLANVKSTNMRKRHSHSVMNLSSVGHDDSSSEDGDKIIPAKPTVPPRTRNLNSDSQLSSRKVTNKDKPKAANRISSYERRKSVELDTAITSTVYDDSTENIDVSTVQLSTQLCDEVALQLTKAANNVVELYRRLTDADANTSEQMAGVQKTDMVKNLEMSIARTQKMLQDLTLERFRQSNSNVNQTDTVKKLNDLVSRGFTNDQTTVVNVMQQYSDILLGLMQQKIQNTNT